MQCLFGNLKNYSYIRDMEKEIEKDWIYVGKTKRFRGAHHQELIKGEWVTFSTLETYLDKLYNEH